MKHAEQRQAGSEYDKQADDRLVKAAYDFNLSFAASFQAEVRTDAPAAAGSSAAVAGSSSAAPLAQEGGEESNGAGAEDGGGGLLADDEWRRVPGGPFTAKLMTRSRQPVSTATYRNYGVAVPIDPLDGPLYPGCEIKFPVVAGAPSDGIICQLPPTWGAEMHVLIFKLKLSKAGATEPTVTIASALYREPRIEVGEEEEEAAVAAADLAAEAGGEGEDDEEAEAEAEEAAERAANAIEEDALDEAEREAAVRQ